MSFGVREDGGVERVGWRGRGEDPCTSIATG